MRGAPTAFWLLVFSVHGVLFTAAAEAGLARHDAHGVVPATHAQHEVEHQPSHATECTTHLSVARILSNCPFEVAGVVPAESGAPAGVPVRAVPQDESSPDVVLHELPPAPSSLTLGLTALAGLGLYQAGRSIRKFSISALPEWYHTGGPQQVGYATPLDIEKWDIPACVLDVPAGSTAKLIRFVIEEADVIPDFHIPLCAAPRGPPRISLMQ